MEKVSIYGPFAHPYAGFAPRAAATTWRGALPRALGSPVLSHASFSLYIWGDPQNLRVPFVLDLFTHPRCPLYSHVLTLRRATQVHS